MTRILSRVLAGFLALIVVFICFLWLVLLRPVSQPATHDPLRIFNHGSIGNESEQGIPYWIWRVLPTLFPEYLPRAGDGYSAIGVYWIPGDALPVGFSEKTLGVIPRVAPNCAFCHQASYRLHPDDIPTFVPAGPGTRVDVQSYLLFLTKAGTDPRFTSDNIMAQIAAIYDMPLWERLLYRIILIPAARSALQEQSIRFAWMRSRPPWGPGRIDPFNPVKFHNLGLPDDRTVGNSDMMPLWALDHLVDDPTRHVSLHWDGLNSSLHETVLAGAIGDGLTYQSLQDATPNLQAITDFIRLQGPPPSPFSSRLPTDDPYHVDAEDILAGRLIYEKHCAECHDPDGHRFRTVIPASELGTDRHRIDMWTQAARDRYTNYEDGYRWGFHAFHKTNGYIANELTGLWLRGPYLHNGSVPTLRALLSPPSERPRLFRRGSDLIDPVNGGFVSTPDSSANRLEFDYDTTVMGNGNEGHLYGTGLTEAGKRQLLAYLKTL